GLVGAADVGRQAAIAMIDGHLDGRIVDLGDRFDARHAVAQLELPGAAVGLERWLGGEPPRELDAQRTQHDGRQAAGDDAAPARRARGAAPRERGAGEEAGRRGAPAPAAGRWGRGGGGARRTAWTPGNPGPTAARQGWRVDPPGGAAPRPAGGAVVVPTPRCL